jgi:hypothetical protein
LGIGAEIIEIENKMNEKELLEALKYDHSLIYGNRGNVSQQVRFVPANVAFDKVVNLY